MLEAKTLDVFLQFLDVAKSKNLDYAIFGTAFNPNASHQFENEKSKYYKYRFVLCCPLFTVYVIIEKIENHEKFEASLPFEYIPFADITCLNEKIVFGNQSRHN